MTLLSRCFSLPHHSIAVVPAATRPRCPNAVMRLVTLLLAVVAWFNVSARTRAAEPSAEIDAKKSPPNVLFILADDLGRHQVGCYGSRYYRTPHLDQLSREGMQFQDAYAAAPVCSPTRASIMTGRSPARLHLTDYIPGRTPEGSTLEIPDWQKSLPLEEVTIAEHLRRAGYRTGHFGKWHLSPDKYYEPGRPGDPGSQGFDVVLTTHKPKAGPPSPIAQDWHHTRQIAKAANEFVTAKSAKPFFCYVSFNAIHDPEIERPEIIGQFSQRENSGGRKNPVQAAMLFRTDEAIGSLLETLEVAGKASETLVIFFSDNGQKGPKTGDGFRGSKGDLYEGGIRMPLIVRWPSVVPAGSRCHTPVISHDFLPTIVEAATGELPHDTLDGVSLLELLRDPEASLPRQALHWHYPHYHSLGLGPQSAIRVGPMKLIMWHERVLLDQPDRYELYDLSVDPGERVDLSSTRPATTLKLVEHLNGWMKRVDAQMPVPR